MDIKFEFSKYIIKPIGATCIMAVCSYAIYIILLKIISLKIAAVIAMGSAVGIYVLAIISLKVFTKEKIKNTINRILNSIYHIFLKLSYYIIY